MIKIIIGVNLISYATRRRAGMEARKAEDAVNDYGRDPVGEGTEERVSGSVVLRYLHPDFAPLRNTTANSKLFSITGGTMYLPQRISVKTLRGIRKVREGKERREGYRWRN